jgi:hypothetical protein
LSSLLSVMLQVKQVVAIRDLINSLLNQVVT